MARGGKQAVGGGFSGLSAFLILLTVAAACASVVAVKVGNAPALPWPQVLPVGVYAVSVPFAWVWLRLSGYRGDGVALRDNFSQGRYLGVPYLQWLGMSLEPAAAARQGLRPYPHMLRWLCERHPVA